MSGPMSGVQAPQLVPLQPREQDAPRVEKQGPSRFDGVLAHKAEAVQDPSAELVPLVEPVTATREAPRVGHLLSQVVGELEEGQRRLEALIQASASGKRFTTAELLSLQASMYKYTQELDLTGKVVEKATSGLKDLAKTQV